MYVYVWVGVCVCVGGYGVSVYIHPPLLRLLFTEISTQVFTCSYQVPIGKYTATCVSHTCYNNKYYVLHSPVYGICMASIHTFLHRMFNRPFWPK